MAMRLSSSLASPIEPASATMRPVSVCGKPSGPISPLMLADSGVSIRELAIAETRGQQKVARRDAAGFELDFAEALAGRRDRGRKIPTAVPGLSEPMVTSTPPRGRSTPRLMSWNVQCLPVRASSTVRLPFLRPSSRRSWPSRPVSPMPSIQDNSAAKTSRARRDGTAGVGGRIDRGRGAAGFAIARGRS